MSWGETFTSSSCRMRVIYHNWSATKQRLHPQSVAEINRNSVLSGDRIQWEFPTGNWDCPNSHHDGLAPVVT